MPARSTASTCACPECAKSSSGSGENSTTNQIILWQSDQNVPQARWLPDRWAAPSPSIFDSCRHCDHQSRQPRDKILVLLHAQADVPGVDYSDDFEIPVFRGASSPEVVRVPNLHFFLREFFRFRRAARRGFQRRSQPAHAKVSSEWVPVALTFIFPISESRPPL